MGAATKGAFPGKTSPGSRLGKTVCKEAMSDHALRREASPDPHSPQPPARPLLYGLGPAYLTEGDPRPGPPGDRARGSPSRCGGYTSMAAGGGERRCRCEGRSGPPACSRPAAAGRGGGACRVGGGRGARGHVGGGGGAGRAQGSPRGRRHALGWEWAHRRRAAPSLSCEAAQQDVGSAGHQDGGSHAAALHCPQAPHHGVGLSAAPPATHADAPGGGAWVCPAPLCRLRPPAKASAAAPRSRSIAGT